MANQIYKKVIQGGFWQVNKTIARHFKCINTAVVLDELIFHETKHADENGFFFYSAEILEENCMIGTKKRRTIFDALQSAGILEIQKKGLPARFYFKINHDAVDRIFETDNTSECKNALTGPCKNAPTILYTNNIIKKNVVVVVEEELSEDGSATTATTFFETNKIREMAEIDKMENYFLKEVDFRRLKAPGAIKKVYSHYQTNANLKIAVDDLQAKYAKRKPYPDDQGPKDKLWTTDCLSYIENALLKEINR